MKPGNKVSLVACVLFAAFLVILPGGLVVAGVWSFWKRYRPKTR